MSNLYWIKNNDLEVKGALPGPRPQCHAVLCLFFRAEILAPLFSRGHLPQTGWCSVSSFQRIYDIDLGNKVNWNELWVLKVGVVHSSTIKMEFFSFKWRVHLTAWTALFRGKTGMILQGEMHIYFSPVAITTHFWSRHGDRKPWLHNDFHTGFV